MQLELTADQGLLQDAVRRLLTGEYGVERRTGILATEHGSDSRFWSRLAEQGVLGVGLSAEHGGFGSPMDVGVVMEQLGRHLVLEPFLSTVALGGGLIDRLGSAEQRRQLLPAIIAGQCLLAVARLDDDAITSQARTGGGWSLSGTSTMVPDAAIADWLILTARDVRTGESSAFLLDAAAKGIRRVNYRTHDGRSAADIHLAGVTATSAALLGADAGRTKAASMAEALAIPGLCAEAVGIMDALIEATLGYLQTRSQFAQPIGRFQALQHRLADMYVMATQARSMSLLACDRAQREGEGARRIALSSAKAYIDKAARFIGQNAIQLHGGMGMTAELMVSHYFKRLTLIGTSFGDRAYHLGRVSDALLAQDAMTDES